MIWTAALIQMFAIGKKNQSQQESTLYVSGYVKEGKENNIK